MSLKDYLRKIAASLLKKFIAVPELKNKTIGTPQKILVIRQHNQFGDLLASVSLFRAIKETFPNSKITLIASSENYYAVLKNELIDKLFVFDNKKIWNGKYFIQLKKTLKQNYDLAIVPVTVAISLTSCMLAGFANAKIKIGPSSLNGAKNNLAFVFHHRINMDWRKCPDAHVSDFILDIIRPFDIITKNYSSTVWFDEHDVKMVKDFVASFSSQGFDLLIGFHIGAGKLTNKWHVQKFVDLIDRLKSEFNCKFYFTASDADSQEINSVKNKFGNQAGYFLNKSVPQLAALISISNLFITNDTGVMHVAGAVATSQISLFGPTNPFNWAPVGPTKYFLRKSEFIDDISVEDVFELAKYILEKHKK